MSKSFVLAAVAAAAGVLSPFAARCGEASRMDRSRLQIGAYCLASYARTEAHVRDVKDCGIDFLYGIPASDRATLDLCAKYGIGVIATGAVPFWHGMGGEQAGRMKDLRPMQPYVDALAEFSDHPAVWMLDFVDEASALDFPWIGEVSRLLRDGAPAGVLPFVNLYPNYASVARNTDGEAKSQLGTATYREHVASYVRNVPLDYICYDFYLYSAGKAAREKYLRRNYDNMKDVADACRAAGRDFWYVPQVNSVRPDLWLSENMLRYQAYCALAHGARVIAWACWSREPYDETPDMPGLVGWWTNNVLTLDGRRTEQYEKLRKVNAELHGFGERYSRYRGTATHFVSGDPLDTECFSGLKADDGALLIVGEMTARDGGAGRALVVFAADDPFDEHPAVHRVSFRDGAGELRSFSLSSNRAVLLEGESPLGGAAPVWRKGGAEEMNDQLVFRGTFKWNGGDRPVLRAVAPNPYRVRLNGRFAWYGPARAPKGFFRLDEIPLDAVRGENSIEVECAGYNCATYYFQRQPSFLDACVSCGGRDLLKTSAGGGPGSFRAEPAPRVRRVNRYSHARAFGEAYILPGTGSSLALEEFAPPALLKRRAAPPDFSVADDFSPVTAGKCGYDERGFVRAMPFADHAGLPGRGVDGFPANTLEFNLWADSYRFRPGPGRNLPAAERYALGAGEYAFFEAPKNRTGFPVLSVKCIEPGEMHVLFDERPVPGEFKPWRSVVANDVAWRFTEPGDYEVETIEPYVLKAFQIVARSGSFEISAPRLRLYRNAESRRARFRSSDRSLECLFAAAEENFAQNSVDGFMDCPGRERSGWNCDAFFTARASELLSGNVSQETLFFENFAVPRDFGRIERGMIPMCWPADSANGNYIPSWAMFFVLELDEYVRLRGGDRALAEALRPRVTELVAFLRRYANSDGLLERLPRWVFVEWSAANRFVQDVNYPNNMIWAAALEAVDRLYGMPGLSAEAEKVRDAVRRQSWTGEWFCDNAVRQADGSLKLSGECTETCQYYAFYFGVATKASHPALYARLVDEFGPRRAGKGLYPSVYPSAPFIGNFLRLDWLGREGMSRKVIDETRGYFLSMAESTGTLWENADSRDNGSCCHGFASHVAVFLARDAAGVKAVDRKAKTVAVRPPDGIDAAFCEVDLPVDDGMLTLGWRREGGRVVPVALLPPGWRAL